MGNYWVWVLVLSERFVCWDVFVYFDCGVRGRRGGMGEKRGFVMYRRSGLLWRDEMDFVMLYLMDLVLFCGVCYVLLWVWDVRDLIVFMVFFGFGKK